MDNVTYVAFLLVAGFYEDAVGVAAKIRQHRPTLPGGTKKFPLPPF